MAAMKKAYDSAYRDLQGERYPYMLLDQSQKGQLSPYRLHTNIFDRFPVCYSVDGMKAYVIGAQDFELFFDVFSEKEKFTANERSKPKENISTKVCEAKCSTEKPDRKLEWDTESEWESEPERPDTRYRKRPRSSYKPEQQPDDGCKRDRLRRQFEETLY